SAAVKIPPIVGPEKIFPTFKIDPRPPAVLPDETDQFARRQFVGRLATPDVARLTAVLTPVRQRDIELRGPGRPADVRVQDACDKPCGTCELIQHVGLRSTGTAR